MNAPKATIDYETRSACNLKKQGPWKYATHPSTQIMCLAFRLPHWEKDRVEVWHPAFPHLEIPEEGQRALLDLQLWIAYGGLVEAHNVWFEYCIWQNIQVKKRGCAPIPIEQWRCSAAKAAVHALPRGLDDAVKALRLPVHKDMEGHKLMLKVSKPRKTRKAERAQWAKEGVDPPKYVWWEDRPTFERIWAYCRKDVLAEERLSRELLDLSEQETDVFLADLRINARGFQLDREAVAVALRLLFREALLLNLELADLTEKQVLKATQRARMLKWFEERDFPLPDTQAATIDDLLVIDYPEMDPIVRRALELVRALGRSSTAKYQAMKQWMGNDARVRGGLLYHGASTGRWSGKGIQPQNFPKGVLKKVDVDDLWTVLKRGHRLEIQSRFVGVMEALSSGLRGAITAKKGQQLYVADYASIEARVLLWLADDQDSLEVFRDGRDIYLEMASSIYGYPCNKDDHPMERALGKVAILGLGYQMGVSRFQATCELWKIPIEEAMAQRVVAAYRAKFVLVKQMWAQQEEAALTSLSEHKSVTCGRMQWFPQGNYLFCRLPSGRKLAYPFPQIRNHRTSWGADKPSLSYMGVDPITRQWRRQVSYGGLLVENQTQAVARDIIAEALLRCEADSPYPVVLSVHDELIAETPLGVGSVEEFTALLTEPPEWALDCPIEAEGWVGTRYRK